MGRLLDECALGFLSLRIPRKLSPEEKAEAKRREAERHATLLNLVRPWDAERVSYPKADRGDLVIEAASYNAWAAKRDLFPHLAPDVEALSPVGPGSVQWAYKRRTLPRMKPLALFQGKRRGASVYFDGPVTVPVLSRADQRWAEPWMSLTPMEVITLRPGTKRAKGHTVIAGLGLGHQLLDVVQRPKVERVTVVERDGILLAWLLPKVMPLVMAHGKPVDVILGDAFQEIPKLTADVALIDIFPGYGDIEYEMGRLRRSSPNIGAWWGWGQSGGTR